MQDKKIIVLIIVSIFAISSIIYGIVTPSKAKREASTGSVKQQADKSLSSTPVKRCSKHTGFSEWGRNPFAESQVTSGKSNGLCISGIMLDGEKPLAIINGIMVRIGDKVGGNTVVNIRKDRVILNDGARDFEIRY